MLPKSIQKWAIKLMLRVTVTTMSYLFYNFSNKV